MHVSSSVRAWAATAVAVLCLGLFGAGTAAAQVGGTIRGTVVDAGTQRPLVNARVVLVGQGMEARSDENGSYELRGVNPGQYTLQALFIGYTRQDQTVAVSTGQVSTVNFSLSRAPIQLQEMVVTGTAGRTEKREIGNAVTSLSVEDLTQVAPIANVQELLQARSPGLSMYKNSGLMGASSSVKIRGAGSINAGYVPVYYIDGIRFEGSPVTTGGVTNSTVQYSSPLDFINPSDIERVEVIKGPAAATLYGADAAGGVIQIITKKGTRGADRVQWQVGLDYAASDWTSELPTNYYQCNAARIRNAGTYPGCNDPSSIVWRDKNAVTADNPLGEVTGIPESDILRADPVTGEAYGDSMFVIKDTPLDRHPTGLRTGTGYDVRLSARGGGQLFNYYLSFNRMDEDGVLLNNYQQRTGGRANFEFTPTGKLNLGVNFGYTRMHYRLPLTDNASNGLLRNSMRGRARAYNDQWDSGFHGFGPDQSNEYNLQTFEERTTLGLTASFDPFSWWENKLVLGMDKYDRRDQTFYEIDSTFKWGATNGTGSITQRIPVTHTWTVDYSGSLRARLASTLTSRFSAGMQLNARQYRRWTASGDGLVANNLNLVGSAANTEASEGLVEQTSLGFYLQEQLGWRDVLFVTGAVRVDDNSAFGSNFSLVVYPKVSAAYVISDEAFFNLPMLDELKLRFAWGQAGNAPAPFSADRTFSPEVTTFQDAPVNALTPSSYGNTELKAETGNEYEMGFDASLFNGVLGLEFTYYNQSTKDALMSIPDAPSTGFTGTHLVNIGDISNKGLELLATVSPVRNRTLQWDVTLAASTNSNKLVSFGGTRDEIQFGSFNNAQRHREGYPLGGFWAVDVIRDANGAPVEPVTVDLTCTWPDTEDPDGYGGSCHERYVGPSTPTREFGFANTFTILGNLRFFANLDYKGGHYIVCAICSIRNRSNTNSWEVVNPLIDPVEYDVLTSTQTETHIMQADFLKLREIAATYTIPASWGGPFRASRWSLTVSARNLWTTTKYKGTGDPEVAFNSGPNTFDRTDYASVPQPRRLTASINVNF